MHQLLGKRTTLSYACSFGKLVKTLMGGLRLGQKETAPLPENKGTADTEMRDRDTETRDKEREKIKYPGMTKAPS